MVDVVAKKAPKGKFRRAMHGIIMRGKKQKLGNPKT